MHTGFVTQRPRRLTRLKSTHTSQTVSNRLKHFHARTPSTPQESTQTPHSQGTRMSQPSAQQHSTTNTTRDRDSQLDLYSSSRAPAPQQPAKSHQSQDVRVLQQRARRQPTIDTNMSARNTTTFLQPAAQSHIQPALPTRI